MASAEAGGGNHQLRVCAALWGKAWLLKSAMLGGTKIDMAECNRRLFLLTGVEVHGTPNDTTEYVTPRAHMQSCAGCGKTGVKPSQTLAYPSEPL